jgi:hypothetical protein
MIGGVHDANDAAFSIRTEWQNRQEWFSLLGG